jgi:hypothetical protein
MLRKQAFNSAAHEVDEGFVLIENGLATIPSKRTSTAMRSPSSVKFSSRR